MGWKYTNEAPAHDGKTLVVAYGGCFEAPVVVPADGDKWREAAEKKQYEKSYPKWFCLLDNLPKDN
jgi:hypothetical protein